MHRGEHSVFVSQCLRKHLKYMHVILYHERLPSFSTLAAPLSANTHSESIMKQSISRDLATSTSTPPATKSCPCFQGFSLIQQTRA